MSATSDHDISERNMAGAAMRMEADLAAWAADAEAERAALLSLPEGILGEHGLAADEIQLRADALREKSKRTK